MVFDKYVLNCFGGKVYFDTWGRIQILILCEGWGISYFYLSSTRNGVQLCFFMLGIPDGLHAGN